MQRTAAALPIILLVVACTPAQQLGPTGTTGTIGPTVPPATGAPTGPVSTAAASPAASVLAATELPQGQSVDLEPGRYTRAAFTPRITFEVGEGWRAVQVGEGFFDIQQDVGSPDVIAVQFARPEGVYGAGGMLVGSTTAADAAEAIQANPALTVLGSSPSRMSGLEGVVVEVENPRTAGAPAQILSVPPGPLAIDPARRLWIALFDTPEGLVAILVGGSVAAWEAALLAAEPVLETVTIGQ
jgi:hypothetical protein